MSAGIVYILTNAAMPGYIKIGMTQQDDVASRVKGLDNTSLPLPFECYFSARVPDCRRLERTLHFVFGDKRARGNREFFTAAPDLVKAIIELVAIEDITPTDAEQSISPAQREAIEETRARAERRTFERLGLPPGTVLTFAKDPDVICTVAGPRKVTFESEEMTVSAAAMIVVRRMGYTWPTVNGFEYWCHEGVRLSDMAMPTADSDDALVVG
jgi:hypothetical protein